MQNIVREENPISSIKVYIFRTLIVAAGSVPVTEAVP